jgi:uncharacterized protein (TIGR02646 family)
MRPIDKWIVGKVVKGITIQDEYIPWASAKLLLEANIGAYCSYCEKPITDEGMHVEHVQPKGLVKYNNLKYKWTNFLVSCQRCNGPDNKHNKDVIFSIIHLPHRNNTYRSIAYFADGSVDVKSGLSTTESTKAKKLIELVGLGKMEGDPQYKEGDQRYKRRKTVWGYAERLKADFESPTSHLTAEYIAGYAVGRGFWSVWMNVFQNHPTVLQALITAFEGTFPDCLTTDINRNAV